MSASDDPERNNTDERESWTDLFGSVFGLADEVAGRIGPEEIEEGLRHIRRRAGYGERAEPPRTSAAAGASGTIYLSIGRRSFTVTVNVDHQHAGSEHRRRLAFRARILSPEAAVAHRARPRIASAGGTIRLPGFWGGLDSADQLAFQRLAGERRYVVGEELMREGETADHVVVILEGRTAISVRDGASQRVVAYRGPGELVGERAALQVSVRSATVVAVEAVLALVMRTQDFAAFLSAHPAVLKIIEEMVYQRLTEDPVRSGYGPVAKTVSSDIGVRRRPKRQGVKPRRLDGKHCTVVAVDVVGFGGLIRNDEDRRIVHRAMFDMTRSALTGTWEKCSFEDRGDGMLIAVPAAIPTLAVVERLTGALPAELRRHNRIYNVCAQIQMLIAVDTGPVESRDRAMSGKVLGRTRQLLRTPDLANAISRSRANLGMIVSADVYDTAICPHGEPVNYGQVWVEEKGVSQQAWMQVIDPAPERLAVTA
jgi:Cyclic nucleotide-binding domain